VRFFARTILTMPVIAWSLFLVLLLCGCGISSFYPEKAVYPLNNAERVDNDLIALPTVEYADSSVADALYRRVSRRSFSSDALDLYLIGSLLWSAGGVGVDGISGPTRTIASAGATYPLDIYLLTGNITGLAPGIYSYDYISHALNPHLQEDRRKALAAAALNQDFIATAPASIVLIANYERTTTRYGERGVRYVYMDAGSASQNIYLLATELGLSTVAIGAFDDDRVAEILAVRGTPLIIMPLGLPEH
jgi:SagB-type dehydrogenase family enzyme